MKTRIINTDIWQADEFDDLDIPEIMFCIYLISNEYIGLTRIYKLNEKSIRNTLGLDSSTITQYKTKLQSLKLFHFVDKYVYITNDFSYCDYKGGKTEKAKNKEIVNIPDDILNSIAQSLPNDCYIIDTINHKSYIINNKPELINNNKEIIDHKSEMIKGIESFRNNFSKEFI